MRDDFLRPTHYPLLETLLFHKNLPMKGTFTNADAAELFGVTVRTIQLRVRRGQLKARRLPGRSRFLAADLEQFLAASSTGAQPDTGL